MRYAKLLFYSLTFFFTGVAVSCSEDGGVNIFSVEEDIALGADMDQYLEDSLGNDILSPSQYPEAYNMLRNDVNYILNSEDINYRDRFAWEIHIIRDNSQLNAFAVPGGYIYVYTGLIAYLDCYDHLAGVIAHEIAHADQRHSTEQLTKAYGTQLLLDVVLGENAGLLGDMTNTLISLNYSRTAEEEADEMAVNYTCQSNPLYEPTGVAGFFQKLEEEGQGSGTPEFLSTHPNPANRVQNIQSTANTLGCESPSENCHAQRLNQLQQALGVQNVYP